MKNKYILLIIGLVLVLNSCPSPTISEPISDNAAINERLSLSLRSNTSLINSTSISKENLKYEVTPGYTVNLIDTADEEIIFDLIIDQKTNVRLNDYVQITFKNLNGDVIAKQSYKVATFLASSDLVLNLENIAQQDLKETLAESEFKIVSSGNSDELLQISIGKQSSANALRNMLDLLDQTSQINTKEINQEAKIIAGYNFAYQLNPYRVRSLDPSCNKQAVLRDYIATGWQKIVNLVDAHKATNAFGAGFKGKDIVVVLMDSGVDNEDDFDCENTPNIKEGHGTHVRDIIKTLSPDVTIVSKKIFSHTGNASIDTLVHTSDLLKALSEIEKNYLLKGKKVIVNMSFSAPSHPDFGPDLMLWGALNQYYKRYKNNLLIVASAGNHGFDSEHRNEYFYPAGFMHSFKVIEGSVIKEYPAIPNIVSVGSTGLKNNRVQAADYNPNIDFDVLAHGINICSKPDCSTRPLVGSSFSAPVISALSALLWDQCENFDSTEVIRMLKKNSLPVPNKTQGFVISRINHNCQFRDIPSAIAVSPESGFTVSGIQTERDFKPTEQCYTLKNVGPKRQVFRINQIYWLDSSVHILRLDSQTTGRVCISIKQQHASELSLGTHKGDVVFINDEDETDYVKREVAVIVKPFVSLRLEPIQGFTVIGTTGQENFTPSNKCYTLTNKGPKTIEYDANTKEFRDWLIISSENGQIMPNESKEVCISINQKKASKKQAGSYTASVEFLNDGNPADNKYEIDVVMLVK